MGDGDHFCAKGDYDPREHKRLKELREYTEERERIARMELENKNMKYALRRIAKWDFDIRGDCVADAQELAKRVLGIKVTDR